MTQAPVPHLGPGPRRPATLADLDGVPSTHVGHLIRGQLYALPRPRLEHSGAQGGVLTTLDGPFQRGRGGSGGWVLLIEPEVRIAGDAVVPDLAGWRRERLPGGARGAHATVAPDWVCEVLSPGTEVFDRGAKAAWYASVGVSWLWFVDPEARTLEVYENVDGFRQKQNWQGEAEVSALPFEALTWDLASLWGLSGISPRPGAYPRSRRATGLPLGSGPAPRVRGTPAGGVGVARHGAPVYGAC